MPDKTVILGALGSGSSGNAFIIEYNNRALIVDQGFSRRELLKRMDEDIWVTSEKGEGTEFSFTIHRPVPGEPGEAVEPE